MSVTTLLPPALIIAGFLLFSYGRLKAYLMFFQQEEYDNKRFVGWLWQKRAFDLTMSTLLVLLGAILFLKPDLSLAPQAPSLSVLLFVAFWLGYSRSQRALRDNKKPLVMTQRARRIHQAALALAVAAAGLVGWLINDLLGLVWAGVLTGLAMAQAMPFMLIGGNLLMAPVEKGVKARYRREAVEKLGRLNPKIVAITGSFGKTTTKQILAHILSAGGPTLATPGSVNTEMGITRIIREKLDQQHRTFIVEMGAYGPGSIARLCRLAPPDLAMVTAVGPAHYERFKTLETVFDAKFEIAEACAARGGKTIVNASAVLHDKLRERTRTMADNLVLAVDRANPVDGIPAPEIVLEKAEQTAAGLALQLKVNGEDASMTVPLYGQHQAQNIMMAIAAAHQLGMPMATIKAALATVPQVRHRLEVTHKPDGLSIIDDAYNSNPVGFASALEMMDILVGEGGRRILITPGMVELGAKHDDEHRRLGELATRHVDIALPVTPQRIPTFVAGFGDAMNDNQQLIPCATQSEAQAWLDRHVRPGDVVLYENNLPDLYEASVRF